MNILDEIKGQLRESLDEEKAAYLPRFFQAGEGGYGEGDQFLGVTVPIQRKIARKYYKQIELMDVETLLKEPIHEYRLVALFILVSKFEKSTAEQEQEAIVNFYLNNIQCVNNWDLVDSSAYKILGPFLFAKDKGILYDFAQSSNLWKQRIAIISTFYFIKQGHFDDALEISEILLHHKHDLIHKAVGWMLREIGNRNFKIEFNFLKDHYNEMPRTMLRYAIEKYEPDLRQRFLKGRV
ncbi:DNA alkylation repair protein [Desulfitobacterium sp.]|uniref:DNA alkylation repair protein n=1 Tax=Desulfitobacterium sp. TaxID=49981 RepID=UPI002B6465D6|nr:DNA alkylation repair protein [Desulfitobacterium sp.]HVJ48949.1 DNA alkylation repair protein [Desulfitobacterium sp.]